MQDSRQVSPFGWNAAGWFGGLLGCTAWLLALSVSLFAEDLAAGALALAGFAVGNLWGIVLWRRRDRLSAYSGLQWLLGGLLVVFAAVVWTTNARATSMFLPYWVIAVPLPLMVMFWLRQWVARWANTA